MKENVIFCYSGTGNCLDMAKNIAKQLGDTDIIMMRRYPAVTDVREAKRVGFIFPCYGGGLPGHVERYLHDIKVSPDAYTFGIAQCAAYKGEGLYKLNELIPLDYWAAVQARSEHFAERFARDIKAGMKTEKKLGKALVNNAEHAGWPMIARMQGQSLKANDNCVMCGTCAKVCPMDNIRYMGKAVVFGDKCISCCACVQYCPQEAINFGNITQNRERYHNVNITVDDLNQEIISF